MREGRTEGESDKLIILGGGKCMSLRDAHPPPLLPTLQPLPTTPWGPELLGRFIAPVTPAAVVVRVLSHPRMSLTSATSSEESPHGEQRAAAPGDQ